MLYILINIYHLSETKYLELKIKRLFKVYLLKNRIIMLSSLQTAIGKN